LKKAGKNFHISALCAENIQGQGTKVPCGGVGVKPPQAICNRPGIIGGISSGDNPTLSSHPRYNESNKSDEQDNRMLSLSLFVVVQIVLFTVLALWLHRLSAYYGIYILVAVPGR
jgi:hypothetical protein